MKKQIPKLLVCLLLVWLILPSVLYAAFEPSKITIDGVSTNTAQKVPEGNLDAVITDTTADLTGYTIDKYVYVWNNSSTALGTSELGVGSTSVDYVAGNSTVISVDAKTTFANSNGKVWYLHVKTVYFSTAGGTAISDDKVSSGYTFDNVAPVATISLDTNDTNQTATTSTSNILTVKVNGDTSDIVKVYVYTADQFSSPSKSTYDFSNSAQTTLSYTVAGAGSYTLYAWFEDEVGNVSSDAATLQLEVLAGKSIEPAGAQNLEVDGTLTFQVSGAASGETFTWSIVDATTGAASTAATIEGANPAASVVVKGVTENATVKVKATPNAGSAYESGTITIVKTTPAFKYDVDKNGAADALTDGIVILRYLFGLTGDSMISNAVAPNATVTAAQDISTYLDTGKVVKALDVDGNGSYDALTDGIVILRYLFGLTGTAMTSNAIAPNATRTDPAAIVTFMEQYKP